MTIRYSEIPGPAQFQRDSSVTMAFRKDDRILVHLDWLLDRYQATWRKMDFSKLLVITCDIYLTAEFWIRSLMEHQRGAGFKSTMRKERYPAVYALAMAALKKLRVALGCRDEGEVMAKIEEIFERDMHEHGYTVDVKDGRARYLNFDERKIYRLRFKGGLAFQYPWWMPGAPLRLIPADSGHAYVGLRRRGANGAASADTMKDFGGFVMTTFREVFMARHDPDEGIFHSSYVQGGRVMMAGTMLIKHGKIKAIRGDSGHYHPTEMNMTACLQGLAMYGVDLGVVRLVSWDGKPLGSALSFLKSNVSWKKFQEQGASELQHRAELDRLRNPELLAMAEDGDYNSTVPVRPNAFNAMAQ